MLEADAPEEGPEGIGLLDAEEDQQRDDAGELGNHTPVKRPSGPPWPTEDPVCVCHFAVCRVPIPARSSRYLSVLPSVAVRVPLLAVGSPLDAKAAWAQLT